MMKSTVRIAALALLLLPSTVRAKNPKVAMCEGPTGKRAEYHTIMVDANGVPAHLRNGDLRGGCQDNCTAATSPLCADTNPCTTDTGVWTPNPKGNDGTGTCACVHTPYTCAAPDQCHQTGTCNGDGTCAFANKTDGTACNDGNACTQTDTCQTGVCTGSNPVVCSASDQCHVPGQCAPASGVCSNPTSDAGTVCGNSKSGDCDAQDTCDGAGACVDRVQPATAQCTGTSQLGACDNNQADHCSGTDKSCVDRFQANNTPCGGAPGQCENQDTCNGTSGACQDNGFKAATAPCTGSVQSGACDDNAHDHCIGGAGTCVDAFQPSSYVCASDTGPNGEYLCGDAVHCNGTNGTCPIPNGSTIIGSYDSTKACHSSTGPCDPAEYCTGYGVCAPDVILAAGAECPGAGACELPYTCNGNDAACHQNGIQSSGHPCRPRGTNDCDITERCDGTARDCPADAYFPDGTRCSTVIPKPNPDLNPAAHCLANACVPIPCKYNVECPDGYVCDTAHQCVPAPVDHGAGDACTGQSGNDHGDCVGFLCCAGMAGDGNGVVAGSGVHGRCAACCGEVRDDCGGGATCCDGKCTDTLGDPHNCLGCAYSGTGIDCDTLINACQPSAIKCDETVGGCVMTNNTNILSCDYAAGDSCTIPTETVANPNCNYCDFFSVTPGAGCLSDADCEVAPGLGACHHVYGRCLSGAECDGQTACADGSTCWAWTCFFNGSYERIPEDCRTAPYTFCQVGCDHFEAPANPGTKCSDATDCTGGTTCKSNCGDLYITKGAFCFSDNTCQY
jgi:hypothetical protein